MRELRATGGLTLLCSLGLIPLGAGCAAKNVWPDSNRNRAATRVGDEIIVAGQPVHTGTRIVLWMEPGGYNAYVSDRPPEAVAAEPLLIPTNGLSVDLARFGARHSGLAPNELDRVERRGWDLPTLQKVVDQCVLHYDAAGTARESFRILHELRGLSVHFLVDLDGTIYQTLDVQERAWHATTANDRSVGIEIASIGAMPVGEDAAQAEWYAKDPAGQTRITVPTRFGDGGLLTPGFLGRPARNEPIRGRVQGVELSQYDFTAEQYRALMHLTAALCRTLPKIKCDYPRDNRGRLIQEKLPDEMLARFQGVLGHYHIQTNKVDPGPAFDWDQLITGARRLLKDGSGGSPDEFAPQR